MKNRKIAPWFTLLALSSLTACSSNRSITRMPDSTPQPASATTWKLHYENRCAEPERCLGGYGFTLQEDGSFQAGPGPNQEVWNGHLNGDELATLQAGIQSLEAGVQARTNPDPECQSSIQLADEREVIEVSRAGMGREWISTRAGQLCHITADGSQAAAFHQSVLRVLRNHYPTPFPSACITASQNAKALIAPSLRCSQDSDCTYLDPSGEIIPAGTVGYVAIDQCTWTPTIPVVNREVWSGAQRSVLASLQVAKAACGSSVFRSGCPGLIGGQSDRGAPACVQGACQVSPAFSR